MATKLPAFNAVLILAGLAQTALSGPVVYFAKIHDMRISSSPANKTLAIVGGYWAEKDGGGGQFLYDNASSVSADSGYVWQPATGAGRWLRVNETGINARHFGAKGDSVSNDFGPLK